jgi:hypothetical protein
MITADRKTKTFMLTGKMNCFEMLKQMDELTNCDFDDWNIVAWFEECTEITPEMEKKINGIKRRLPS